MENEGGVKKSIIMQKKTFCLLHFISLLQDRRAHDTKDNVVRHGLKPDGIERHLRARQGGSCSTRC